MAREFGPVNVAIWSDPEWRRLPLVAQHLYLLLWTSPSLTYCGTHDWRPKRIAALAEGYDVELIEAAADCLVARHFIVVDSDTDEVLVRSWARFDGLVKKPRMAVSYATAYAAVASETIRKVLVHETAKMREMWPDLACWLDKRVAEILSHPSTSAKDLPSPSDPFAGGFVPGLRLVYDEFVANAEEGLPLVCDPPTPAPALSPSPNSNKVVADGSSARPSSADAEAIFDEFWAVYPRKDDKGHARKAWKSALKKSDAKTITEAAHGFGDRVRAAGTERRFIALPATWLNGERWDDQPDSADSDDNYRDPVTGLVDESKLPPPEAHGSWMARRPS